MRHKSFVGVLVGLILALVLSAVIGMGVGAVMKSPGEVTTGFFTGCLLYTSELPTKA